MPGNYSKLVTVITGQTITAAERNNEFDNVINNMTPDGVDDASANLAAMQATTDPSGGSLATDLRGELRRLRFQLLKLGAASGNWYDALPFLAGVTPSAAGATATDLNNRLAQIVSQIKNLGGLTNWYDAVTAALLKAGGTMTGDIAMGGFKVTGLGAATTSGDATRYEQVSPLWAYRRPVLKWISVTTVDVENNTGTANQTTILFPDGTTRSVTEDTSSTNKYRRFIITAAAEFTSGTEDSGLRSGISEATNTYYYVYAVKSTIDATKFVLAGDTDFPLQANFATLNSRYGTNGWVPLGLIRNGDNASATGDILNFVQAGNMTLFKNACVGSTATICGTRLTNSAGASSSTYTYSAGTGTTNIPGTISHVQYIVAGTPGNNQNIAIAPASNAYLYARLNNGTGSTNMTAQIMADAASGLQINLSNSGALDINLSGFWDGALGVGPNPLL